MCAWIQARYGEMFRRSSSSERRRMSTAVDISVPPPKAFPKFGPILRGTARADLTGASRPARRFVYVIRSDSDPARHYVGLTSDVRARLKWHNHGPGGHTMPDRPVVVARFDQVCARERRSALREGSEVGIRTGLRSPAFRALPVTFL
jgi:predicted GIY-YIG superfamily endonuclease